MTVTQLPEELREVLVLLLLGLEIPKRVLKFKIRILNFAELKQSVNKKVIYLMFLKCILEV